MSEDPQVWSSVFYWVNYTSEPTMELPQAKYITYTKFIDKHQQPKIIGYIQFSAPIKSDMLQTIHPDIYWTEQRFSNSACMRYIEKINAQEQGELTTLGTHWPTKSYTTTPTPATSPAPQEQLNDVTQLQLKRSEPIAILKKPRSNQIQPSLTKWTQAAL